MDLYLIELAVADWSASVAWYRDVLGLVAERIDEANRFALFHAGASRVALKAGEPKPGGARLYFQVTSLLRELERLAALGAPACGPVKANCEGYRRAFVRDPDGYCVGLFEWNAATRPK
ncbi:MAG: VOC family protein [Gemmataceae bacterium]